MLRLKTLGALDLVGAGGAETRLLAQSKRTALLVYLRLAHPGELIRRDALLAVFWPELDETHARNALSQALSFLRRSLGDGAVVTRGVEEVGIDSGRLGCDVLDFRSAIDDGNWAKALQHYRGEFLEGLHVVGAPGFSDWLENERLRLREMAAAACWRRADELIEAGALVEAERTAQRALRLVPTDETPVRDFVTALAEAGDRGAALRFFERFKELLTAELEVEPAPGTLASVEALKDNGQLRSAPTRRPADPVQLPRSPSPTPHVRYRAEWRVGGSAAAAVLVIAVGAVGWILDSRAGRPGTLIGERLLEPHRGVVVADFSAPFDPDLGIALAECLKAALDQSDVIRPVQLTALRPTLEKMGWGPELPVDAEASHLVAIRDGHPLVVTGLVEDAGEGFVVVVRVEAAGRRDALFRFSRAAAGPADLVRAIDGIGRDIRRAIGDAPRPVRRSPPLEQVTSSSLEAIRLYTQALRLRDLEDRHGQAVPLLEEAIALDTGFAAAMVQLQLTLNELMTGWERQKELSERAFQARHRLTDNERLQLETSYTFNRLINWSGPPELAPDECGIYEPLFRLLQDHTRRHPLDVRAIPVYAFYQRRMGHHDRVVHTCRRALELDSTYSPAYNCLFTALWLAGQEDEALEVQRTWGVRTAESLDWLLSVAAVAGARGEYARADSLLALRQSRFGYSADIAVLRGRLDALRGRFREAQAHYEGAARHLETRGDPARPVVWLSDRALMTLMAHGAAPTEMAALAAALEALPREVDLAGAWVNIGLAHALSGDVGGARQALDTLRSSGRGNWSLVRGPLEAAIALAGGRPTEALERLRSTDIPCSFNFVVDHRVDPRWKRILAGRAYEALGDLDNAVPEYEGYFSDPPRKVFSVDLDAIFFFDTLERLGRLREARSDGEKAAEYYGRAAELWESADPEVRSRVASLRARASSLTGAFPSPGG